MDTIEVHGPKIAFEIPVFGGINITETVILQWVTMAIIMALVLLFTYGLKKYPGKRQVLAEMIVTAFNKMTVQNMGKKNIKYAPYIASLFFFILIGSLISLFGLRTMTADVNVTMTLAIITFVLITINKFKSNGFFGYFKSYTQPKAFITPINIISELATPVSMGFRLFGNMAGGMIITSLIYYGLSGLSRAVGLSIPLFTIGIPAFLSVYFDLFTGVIQSYVFIMLTMAFVGDASADQE